jgi:hypothetical protein
VEELDAHDLPQPARLGGIAHRDAVNVRLVVEKHPTANSLDRFDRPTPRSSPLDLQPEEEADGQDQQQPRPQPEGEAASVMSAGARFGHLAILGRDW